MYKLLTRGEFTNFDNKQRKLAGNMFDSKIEKLKY